ncbi:MAG: DUF881 domain-containing protein [Anaerolineae bacterium]|nr:DUF881 domain-containing protein [Anaerolineae bacterium]
MTIRSRLALVLVSFLLGLGLVAQMRGRRGVVSDVPTEEQAALIGSLVVANAELRREVQKLEGERQAYDKAAQRAVIPQMVEELGRMRIVNGSVEVAGGGVQVTVGAGVNVVDLQDLLNEMRNVGAEAICLNGVRLTIRSALVADEIGILVDGRRIEPPFVFQAVGEPTTMATALNRRGGVLDLLRGAYAGLELEVEMVPLMVLPAVRQERGYVLAQPSA